MMNFLYTLDYDDHRSTKFFVKHTRAYNPASLLVNPKLYIIVDKYEIEALKKLACFKHEEVLSDTLNISYFLESASHMFENTVETDQILRDVIVQVASYHVKALLDRCEFAEMLKYHGDISAEITRKVVTRYGPVEVLPLNPSGDE